MAPITRRATGRFHCRYQKMDPFCVWSRLEPHGKALRRHGEGEGQREVDVLNRPRLYSQLGFFK